MFLIERQSISVNESRLIFSDKFRLNLHPMRYRSYIFLPSCDLRIYSPSRR